MSKSDRADTSRLAIAVELSGVSKQFSQRQRGTGNLWRQFTHPEYRSVRALDGVSMRIARGEFVAYAGPNGAGKSTTFKLLCGMLKPDAGEVRALGMDPLGQRVELMQHTGVLFGGRTELWWDHPVISSFEWKKAVWDIPDETYDRMLKLAVRELELEPVLHTFARELSLGQRMRADLAMLLLHDPELILLDEPTLGLDVLSKQRMIDVLHMLNSERGATILVTSHDMDDLMRMARRVVMINRGRIAFDGAFEALAQSGQLRRITVTARTCPELPGAQLVSSEGERHTFEVDTQATDMRSIMSALSRQDVDDIESARAPIEDVIARLYAQWSGAPHDATK